MIKIQAENIWDRKRELSNMDKEDINFKKMEPIMRDNGGTIK